MEGYGSIRIAGGDTATPLNLEKRLRVVARYVVPNKTRLIDCGCGAGEYVHALIARYGIDAVGIEYSSEKVGTAHRQPDLRNRVIEGNLESIPFQSQEFDVALLNEVLEHIPDERRALAEVRRVLRSGAHLIVFSPNRWFPFETHGVMLRSSGSTLPPYVPLIPYIPVSVGRRFLDYWARNYWHYELRDLITSAGFRVEARLYVWQTFENISGSQPSWMSRLRPVLRLMSDAFEQTPFLKKFGVSQVIVARRP